MAKQPEHEMHNRYSTIRDTRARAWKSHSWAGRTNCTTARDRVIRARRDAWKSLRNVAALIPKPGQSHL